MRTAYKVRQSKWNGECVDVVVVEEFNTMSQEWSTVAQYMFNAKRECVSAIGLNIRRFDAARQWFCGGSN